MNSASFAYLYCFCSLLFLLSCETKPATEVSARSSTVQLTAEETGIDFSNTLTETAELNIIEYLYYYNGGGVAIGDINQDGLEDLYFTANQGPDKLYLNQGNLTFKDISQQANIQQDKTWSSGVVMEDVNNDGFLDIYVCKVGVLIEARNLLYINQKDGTFKEMAAEMGLAFQGFSTQVAFLDYDRDGDLDMYLLNHNIHSVRSYGSTQKRQEQAEFAGDRFYENRLNEAEQKFVEVTQQTGIYSSPLGYGLAISCADLNGDGWTDIYVGNDFHENDYIYLNQGDKTFVETVADWTDHTTQFSMGVDIADLNNDLLPDLFSTDMLPFQEEIYLKSGGEDTDQIRRIKADLGFESQFARNHFQLNTGLGSFIDIALQTRTFATDWSWAVLLQDFDNNGRKDIFVSNGITKRPNDLDYISYLNSEALAQYAADDAARTAKLIEKLPAQKLKNILFRQTDELTFSELGASQVGEPTFSNGAAYADLDGDGYLEIIVNNINQPASILQHNIGTSSGNYLTINLLDPSRQTTKGAKVYAYASGEQFYQELQTVKGYQSSSSHRLHFGLGELEQLDSLVVIWPDGSKQIQSPVSVNTSLEITKTTTRSVGPMAVTAAARPSFDILPLRHTENNFNDDDNEKLIPEKLSREGPAVLYEDLDADGIKDIYIGGAHGHPARLLRGNKSGAFENLEVDDFTKDSRYEDVSVASIDFDGDGDRDLYVTSGGSVAKELDKVLEDRIYLNNGRMEFRRIPLSLPHTNGSVVSVADFDADGFEDIFVGARSIPTSYGLSPYSFVLKNRAGTGVDIAYKERLGMVTDAKWADLDNDNDLDLVFCGDWMPVGMLENTDGQLATMAAEKTVPSLAGFWNSLELVDLNQDGQLDILACNAGTNSLLRADADHPVKLYLGDFDANGAVDPIIFFRYFGRYIPLGSKDKYVSQLPGLKKDFVSYEDYSRVGGFTDLFPQGEELLVETKEVNELRSMVFLSENGGYRALPLPNEVQMLTIQDMFVDAESGSIVYLASNQDLAAVQANAMGTRLGVIDGFDANTQTFGESQWLESPLESDGRAMIPLENGKYLIVTNNNYPYLITLPKF